MEKGRRLFNRIRKPKENQKDVESIYSDDSFYSFIKENDTKDETQSLYPIKELEEVKRGIDEQVLADILDKSKTQKTYKNTEAYLNKNEQICHYVFDKNNKKHYSKTVEVFRNDVIFNTNHERYINEYDPWIFVSHNNVEWPDYVTKLYYTKLTPFGFIARLSYSSNLYLNMAFQNQNFAPMLRIMHYPIYELASKLLRKPEFEDIQKEFVNEKFIMNYGNVEIIYDSGRIQRDFNKEEKTIISYDITDKQPTNIAFNSFYDYVPICFNPPQRDENDKVFYEDPKNLVLSNICFHKNDCHDNWCETHNNNRISFLNKHNHYQEQPYFKQSEIQTLSFCQYINKNE